MDKKDELIAELYGIIASMYKLLQCMMFSGITPCLPHDIKRKIKAAMTKAEKIFNR
jgi:hypothetical protein